VWNVNNAYSDRVLREGKSEIRCSGKEEKEGRGSRRDLHQNNGASSTKCSFQAFLLVSLLLSQLHTRSGDGRTESLHTTRGSERKLNYHKGKRLWVLFRTNGGASGV
jgi:hypothetical protein